MEGACIGSRSRIRFYKSKYRRNKSCNPKKLKDDFLAVWTEEGQRDLQWIRG